MYSTRPLQPTLRRCLPAVLALLALTACESGRSSRPDRTSDSAAPEPDKPTPEMEAHGLFFAGQIEVETLLNRAGFSGRGASGGSSGDSGSGGSASASSAGSGGRGGSRGGGRGRGGGGGSQPAPASTADDSEPAPRIHPSNLPAVRVHLRLTNHGSNPVEIEVPDFNSDLGNFVVQPPKIVLPPNQPVEADPMTSRLGVSADQIPLTVSLLVNGKTETQVLVLQTIKPAVTPDPAAAPAVTPPAAAPP
jgi:hypothetical protein